MTGRKSNPTSRAPLPGKPATRFNPNEPGPSKALENSPKSTPIKKATSDKSLLKNDPETSDKKNPLLKSDLKNIIKAPIKILTGADGARFKKSPVKKIPNAQAAHEQKSSPSISKPLKATPLAQTPQKSKLVKSKPTEFASVVRKSTLQVPMIKSNLTKISNNTEIENMAVISSYEPPRAVTRKTVKSKPIDVKTIRSETTNIRKGRIVETVAPLIKMETLNVPNDQGQELDSGFSENKDVKIDEEDYEDDFEDYESDFEEPTSSDSNPSESVNDMTSEEESEQQSEFEEEKTPIQLDEVTATRDHQKETTVQSLKSQPNISHVTQLISFASAEKKIKTEFLSKKTTRGMELLELINLDRQTFHIYNSPPANYEIFIQVFGNADRKQVYVETDCKEDCKIQTEKINHVNKWTQMPSMGPISFGGDMTKSDREMGKADGVQLFRFIENASNLMSQIYEEEENETTFKQLTNTTLPHSQGYISVNLYPDRRILDMQLICEETSHLLVSHGSTEEDLGGVISIWNLKDYKNPEYLLSTIFPSVTCKLSQRDVSFLFAGLSDGSISLYDLQEPMEMHRFNNGLRSVTYNTSTIEPGHKSPIKAMQLTHSSRSLEQLSNLLTLEENGILFVWSIVKTFKINQSGYNSDLGLAPGGSYKLVKTSTINVPLTFNLDLRTLDFKVQILDSNHILFATDLGAVYHCTRHGAKGVPRLYTSGNEMLVNCLAFNPHEPSIFATGCEDGCLHIYNLSTEKLLLKCRSNNSKKAIMKVFWSPINPALLISQSIDGAISFWDLGSRTESSVVTFKSGSDSLLAVPEKTSIGNLWSSHLALSVGKGEIQLHKFIDRVQCKDEKEIEFEKKLLKERIYDS